jgi:Flp pilus assembly protein TadD
MVRLNTTILCFLSVIVLSACNIATVPNEYGAGDPVQPLTTEERVRMAVRDAAIEARQGRVVADELQVVEAKYKANPNNPSLALDYATTLRKAGLPEQAILILQPIALDDKLATPQNLTEFAKSALTMGDFAKAQIYAQDAVSKDNTYASAYHVLGTAMDAQGFHVDAENNFKKALTLLDVNDPLRASVINNLALSLTAQGDQTQAEALLSTINQPRDPLSAGKINANRDFINAL